VSRPYIFTVFDLNDVTYTVRYTVYLHLVDIELLNFVYIVVLSWVWHLVQMRSDRWFVFFSRQGSDQNGIRATRGESISSR